MRCLILLVTLSLMLPTAGQEPWFSEPENTGLEFTHFNGMSGALYFAEMVGAGGALIDYDNDGDLDLYLVQGRMLGKDKTLSDALTRPAHKLPLSDRMYRNDSADGKFQFTDVTATMGGDLGNGYGMGVASGDINGDGLMDLYVTNLGSNQLLVNTGKGQFTDQTVASGADDKRWSVSSSFLDYDNDGDHDLFVSNYVDYSETNVRECFSPAAELEYCGPRAHEPEEDSLFRNNGDGTFTDVTKIAGMSGATGGALGVITADFNDDGRIDIYVANDGLPNFLWLAQDDHTFIDDAMFAGAAVNMQGAPEASMGVDAADFDRDGDVDLFMTHLARETNTLYLNDGQGVFQDRTVSMGLANPSFQLTGFGVGWRDFNNDGQLDLFIANGAVQRIEKQVQEKYILPLNERNQLFEGLPNGQYKERTAEPVLSHLEVSRGAIFGDLDNDGDTDVVVTNNNGPARLFENLTGSKNHWIGFELCVNDIPALGARLKLNTDTPQFSQVRTDGSYAVANDHRVRFGLGDQSETVSVTITWPDGTNETRSDLDIDSYHRIQQAQDK